jgi:hypothetical protein
VSRAQDGVLTADAVRTFASDGYVVVPQLLAPDEVERYLQRLESRSGRQRGDGSSAGRGWTVPDGVTRHPEFWDVLVHERLLAVVRQLLGPDVRFLQHTDLHVGFSSFNWHRDSVSRALGVGPDWDESDAAYLIVRVGLYLQSAGGAFKLGLVPGTHRLADPRAVKARRAVERKAGWWSHARRLLTGKVPDVPGAEWVPAGAGDAVIFDPRVLHTGTPVDGAKYSMFVAFGVPNRHFEAHARYYRFTRPDLGYEAMAPALVQRLQAAGLYHEVSEARAGDASLPTAVERLAMRRARAR